MYNKSRNAKVLDVCVYKESAQANHEFVVVDVALDGGDEATHRLRFERCNPYEPKDEKEAAEARKEAAQVEKERLAAEAAAQAAEASYQRAGQAVESASLFALSLALYTPVLPSVHQTVALDIVTIYPRGSAVNWFDPTPGSPLMGYFWRFRPTRRLSLGDVTLMAFVIATRFPYYRAAIEGQNGYWYTAVLWKMLFRHSNGVILHEPPDLRAFGLDLDVKDIAPVRAQAQSNVLVPFSWPAEAQWTDVPGVDMTIPPERVAMQADILYFDFLHKWKTMPAALEDQLADIGQRNWKGTQRYWASGQSSWTSSHGLPPPSSSTTTARP